MPGREEKEDERGKYLLGNIYAVYDVSACVRHTKRVHTCEGKKHSVEELKSLRFIEGFYDVTSTTTKLLSSILAIEIASLLIDTPISVPLLPHVALFSY